MRLGTLDNVLHEVRLDEGFLLYSDAIARKKHKDLTASLLQETMPVSIPWESESVFGLSLRLSKNI